MSQQIINTSLPNDGLGDALRDAFNDTNDNFTELYANKVDKVPGKGLSDNNLTDALIATIASNEENSQQNVQSDWLQSDPLEDDYIKNKPALTDVKIPSKVGISFDFPLNAKTDLDSLHGAFLINDTETGQILNSTTPITGTGGVSKVMVIVLAGTVLTGGIIITGTKVDRITGVETPGATETISVDGLSTDNSTIDSNGNPVRAYINNYISVNFWKGTLTFSTLDLNLTNVKFAQIAFEQFDDTEDLVINSLDATYKITNTNANMDAYMYAVEVVGNSANLTMIAELHHETGLEVDAVYRRRQKNLSKQLNGSTDGIFVDLFLAPDTLQYFTNFTIKTWGTISTPIGFYIDSSFLTDSIIYGETLTAGNIAYLAPDGKYYKADNTDSSTSTTQLRLILEGGILDDEINALVQGKYSIAGLTAGNEYLGEAGGVTSTAPTLPTSIVRVISTAISTNSRYFNPSVTWISGDGTNINGVNINPDSTVTKADAWSVGDLDVRAYATNAPIKDQFYTGEPQTITVNPAPTTPDYLRYIAIVMDVNGVITAQDGAEGLAVLPPAVDTENYYLIRYLLIAFGDTEPTDENGNNTNISETLYSETGTEGGGESNVTTNSGAITINAAGSPFGGVGIRGVDTPRYGAYVYFTYTTKKLFSDFTSLNFDIQTDLGYKKYRIYIYFYNGSARVADLIIRDKENGFNAESGAAQNINIFKEDLNIINTEFDSVHIFIYSDVGTIVGYWLDNVYLLNAFAYNPNVPIPVQIQSDWNQTDDTKIDFIKNKPALNFVSLTETETIAGVKTFSSSPIVPAPTTDLQAATKKYVDDNAGGSISFTRVDMDAQTNPNEIDWVDPNTVFLKTMTTDTTFTDANLPTGVNTKEIFIYLMGAYTPTFPSYWVLLSSDYDPQKINKITAQCVIGDNGSELVYYNIQAIQDSINPFASYKVVIDTSLGDGLSSFGWLSQGGVYNGTIDWGDGIVEDFTTGLTHSYATGGIYTIEITGSYPRMQPSSTDNMLKITTVQQWGNPNWSLTDQDSTYRNAINLTSIANDASWWNDVISAEYAFEEVSINSLPDSMTLDSLIFGRNMFENVPLTSLPSAMTLSNLEDGNLMFAAYNIGGSTLTTLPSGMLLNNLIIADNMFNQVDNLTLPPLMTLPNVTTAIQMFRGCVNLTLPTSLMLNNLIDGTNFLLTGNADTAGWSQLLVNLEANNPNNNVSLHGGSSLHNSAGATAKEALELRGWIIVDGGLAP